MGKKKQERIILKPFCYYCDKEFKNETILIKHQKNRHFACKDCRKKFSSAQSLVTHAMQKHRIAISKVFNAKKGRDSCALNIYGMEEIPEEIISERTYHKTVQKYQKLDQQLKKMGINIDDPNFDIT